MTVLRTLLEITIYSAVLFGAILLFRAVCAKKASPALLSAVWFILIARLLMPVTISGVSLIVLPAREPAAPAQQAALPPAADDGIAVGGQAVPPPPYSAAEETWTTEQYDAGEIYTDAAPAAAPQDAVREFDLITTLTALWIAGMAAMLVNIAVAFGRLGRRLAIAPALPERWQEMARRIQQELGIRGNIRFVMLGSFASPALSAGPRPTIVMPMELVWQEDEAMIEFALRHELTHIKRGDHRVCLLLMLLKAVYWFNPIVWLTARLMKMDMETACDSMVVRPMDGERKRRYAATIINMYAKAQPRFVLGMAPGHTRQTAEKRVRGIFMRSRSSRGTVAAAMLLAAVMALACFTTACQPVTEAVSGEKDMPQASAVDRPAPSQTTAPQPSAIQQPTQPEEPVKAPLAVYKTVGHWTGSYERDGSILKVRADADIVMPDVDTYNVYKINSAGKLTQGEVDRIISLLFGDAPIYEYNGQLSKEDLQKQIDKLSAIYQTMQDGTFDFSEYGGGEQHVIDSIKKDINKYKKMMKKAPEATALVLLAGFKTDSAGQEWLRGIADLGEENKAEIIIYNGIGSNGNAIVSVCFRNRGDGYYGFRGFRNPLAPVGNLTIMEDDAKRKAEDFLNALGLSGYELYSSYVAECVDFYEQHTGKYAHVLTYSRVVDGITVSPNCPIPLIETMAYNPEHITFAIDDDGIKQFDWEYKFDMESAVPESVTLLPVEEIEDIIAEQMFEINADDMKHIDDDPDKGFKTNGAIYNINTIRLEYAKLPGGDLNDCRLVPVWNVYATDDWSYTKTVNGEKVSETSKGNRQMVVLTVNAVDGSVVEAAFRA